MTRSKLLATAGLVALVAAVGASSLMLRQRSKPAAELLPYQARTADLPAAEQQRFTQIGVALREAEAVRARTNSWPAPFSAPGLRWVQRGHGLYVNYLGIPEDPARLRWLVLVIEPEPLALKDPAPPEDEQHHTLADGTAIHVSVWTAPNDGPVPDAVLPFPAAEDWTQRLE